MTEVSDFCRIGLLSAVMLGLTSPLAAEPAPSDQSQQVDALTAAPENFRLVVENETVRVLEYTLLPGQKDRQHTHPRRVAHVISGGTLRVGFPDGTSLVVEEKAGASSWSKPAPLHDTENIGTSPIKILLVEVKAPVGDVARAEAGVWDQREAFNTALATRDIAGVKAVLAPDVILVSGTASEVIVGRASQLKTWAEDFALAESALYTRTTASVTPSAKFPLAIETGTWRGVGRANPGDWAIGSYTAKWRKVAGTWLLEAEIFVTQDCGGSFCPAENANR